VGNVITISCVNVDEEPRNLYSVYNNSLALRTNPTTTIQIGTDLKVPFTFQPVELSLAGSNSTGKIVFH